MEKLFRNNWEKTLYKWELISRNQWYYNNRIKFGIINLLLYFEGNYSGKIVRPSTSTCRPSSRFCKRPPTSKNFNIYFNIIVGPIFYLTYPIMEAKKNEKIKDLRLIKH